jgi:hypothetical protein
MNGVNTHKEFSLTIVDTIPPIVIPPAITTDTLSCGIVGVVYTQMLTATGSLPIVWELEDGYLPLGLELLPEGEILGIPLVEDTFNFTVKATNSLDSDTKNLTIVIDKGEDEGIDIIELESLFIYPNPTNGELTIQVDKWTTGQLGEVQIFDVLGRRQKAEGRRQGSEIVFNISNLPAGVYLVRIQTQVGTVMQKVVKY